MEEGGFEFINNYLLILVAIPNNDYTTEINKIFVVEKYHSKIFTVWVCAYFVYLAEAGIVIGRGVSFISGSSSGSSIRS